MTRAVRPRTERAEFRLAAADRAGHHKTFRCHYRSHSRDADSEHPPPVDVERFVRLTSVPLDEAYALLANSRTRLALHALSAAEPPVSVTELAAVVAARDDADERTVEASLVHVVLPKLAGANVLEYDGETGRIRLERPVVAAADPFADPSRPERSEPNASP